LVSEVKKIKEEVRRIQELRRSSAASPVVRTKNRAKEKLLAIKESKNS